MIVRQQIGIEIESETISMIRFADDIVRITESERDLQRAVNETTETLRTFKNENR